MSDESCLRNPIIRCKVLNFLATNRQPQAEKNGSMGYIASSEKDIGLGITGDSVHEVTSYQNDATQIWKKGKPDSDGYFTLTSLRSQKVLTAISDQILEIKGRYHESIFFAT